MSRGLGTLQTDIRDRIKELHNEGQTISGEGLCWTLYFEKKKPEHEGGNLPPAWYNQFRTALKKLEKSGFVKVHRRVLENFEECMQHYPGKTKDGGMRKLRLRMLPILNDWLQTDIRGASPKYGPAQNEIFRLRGLPDSESASICETWKGLLPHLEHAYRTCGVQAEDLFLLLCKGRQYFLNKDVETRYSLTTLSQNTIQSKVLPDPVARALGEFTENFMPTEEARALNFRSIIHFFTTVPSHGADCELTEDTLEHLHQKDRAFIEGMEGTTLHRTLWNTPMIEQRRNFSPQLRKLFDHSVFRTFRFLEPV